MASVTRFYPCGSAAPYEPPTFRGSWTSNPPHTRTLADDKTGARVGPLGTGVLAPSSNARGICRFVSNPLEAQTLSGTLNMAINVQEDNLDANYFTKVFLYATVGDTDVSRGTLLDFEDTGGTEWTDDAFGKVFAFSSAQTLSSLAVQAGDRLVLEFGAIAVAGTASTRVGTAWFGATDRFFDGSINPDAVVGATGTGVDVAGFFEFGTPVFVQRADVAPGDLLVGNQAMYLYDGTTGALKRRILPIGSEDPAAAVEVNGVLYVCYESLNEADDPENGQIALYDPTTLAYQSLFQTAPGSGPHSLVAALGGYFYTGFTGENLGDGLGGFSCGEDASTAEATFDRTANGVTVMATATIDLSVLISVSVEQVFANGDGAQPTFKIGTSADDDSFAPTSTFTNAALDTEYSFLGTVLDGQTILVTATAATGATSTGSIFVRVYALAQMTAATYPLTKYDSTGAVVASFAAASEIGGTNAIDVASDQRTIYYTSLGRTIQRYDVVTDTQLADFYTLPPALNGQIARGLKILPDGSVLVVDTLDIKRIAADGSAILQTYTVGGQTDWGTIALSPDATEFWVANRADGAVSAPMICKINVSTGAIVVQIDEDAVSLPDTGGGMCSGGITVMGGQASPPDDELNGPGGLDILRAQGRLVTYPIRRVRITPHTYDHNQRLFFSRFELLIQAGVGTVTGQGSDPTIELHCSNDGGFTWPIQRTLSAGVLGAYTTRAKTERLGMARDRVWKVIQTDPVNSIWVGADVDVEEGNS